MLKEGIICACTKGHASGVRTLILAKLGPDCACSFHMLTAQGD